MIANPNPNISAGSMRRQVEYWRGEHAVPEHEFLVMVDPGENPLVTLLQVARLHQAHPFQGRDVTLGDVPDDSTRYMAFTYTGSRDSFWDGLTVLLDRMIEQASDLDDDRSLGERSFARALLGYDLPPLELYPGVEMDEDGTITFDNAWENLL